MRPDALKRAEPILRKLNGSFVPINEENFDLYGQKLLDLVNNAFKDNFTFDHINKFDFDLVYNKTLLNFICQKTSSLLLDENKDILGFTFCFPSPEKPNRLLLKTIGVNPKNKRSGRCVAACLQYIFKNCDDYNELSFCLMAEDNQAHRIAKPYINSKVAYGLFKLNI